MTQDKEKSVNPFQTIGASTRQTIKYTKVWKKYTDWLDKIPLKYPKLTDFITKIKVKSFYEILQVNRAQFLGGICGAISGFPEIIAFSFISGLGPVNAIHATWIGGLVTTLLGGQAGLITGPAASVSIIQASLVVSHGEKGPGLLFVGIIIAGLFQILLGVLLFGRFLELASHPVLIGFLDGLAIVILISQTRLFQNYKDIASDAELEKDQGILEDSKPETTDQNKVDDHVDDGSNKENIDTLKQVKFKTEEKPVTVPDLKHISKVDLTPKEDNITSNSSETENNIVSPYNSSNLNNDLSKNSDSKENTDSPHTSENLKIDKSEVSSSKQEQNRLLRKMYYVPYSNENRFDLLIDDRIDYSNLDSIISNEKINRQKNITSTIRSRYKKIVRTPSQGRFHYLTNNIVIFFSALPGIFRYQTTSQFLSSPTTSKVQPIHEFFEIPNNIKQSLTKDEHINRKYIQPNKNAETFYVTKNEIGNNIYRIKNALFRKKFNYNFSNSHLDKFNKILSTKNIIKTNSNLLNVSSEKLKDIKRHDQRYLSDYGSILNDGFQPSSRNNRKLKAGTFSTPFSHSVLYFVDGNYFDFQTIALMLVHSGISLFITLLVNAYTRFPGIVIALFFSWILEYLIYRNASTSTPNIEEFLGVSLKPEWPSLIFVNKNIILPTITVESAIEVIYFSVTYAIVGLIETLMSIHLMSDLLKIKSRANKDCFAQGTANILCGLFSVSGVAGIIGPSMVNVQAHGCTKLSTLTASITSLFFVGVCIRLIALVPIGYLVGTMFYIVYHTFEWSTFRILLASIAPERWIKVNFLRGYKIRQADALVMVTVIIISVLQDLAVGVVFGIFVAATAFVLQASNELSAKAYIYIEEDGVPRLQYIDEAYITKTKGIDRSELVKSWIRAPRKEIVNRFASSCKEQGWFTRNPVDPNSESPHLRTKGTIKRSKRNTSMPENSNEQISFEGYSNFDMELENGLPINQLRGYLSPDGIESYDSYDFDTRNQLGEFLPRADSPVEKNDLWTFGDNDSLNVFAKRWNHDHLPSSYNPSARSYSGTVNAKVQSRASSWCDKALTSDSSKQRIRSHCTRSVNSDTKSELSLLSTSHEVFESKSVSGATIHRIVLDDLDIPTGFSPMVDGYQSFVRDDTLSSLKSKIGGISSDTDSKKLLVGFSQTSRHTTDFASRFRQKHGLSETNLKHQPGSKWPADAVKAYEIEGSLFYGSAPRLQDLFTPEEDPNTVEIHCNRLGIYDISAVHAIERLAEEYRLLGKLLTLRFVKSSCLRLLSNSNGILTEAVVQEYEDQCERFKLPTRFHVARQDGPILSRNEDHLRVMSKWWNAINNHNKKKSPEEVDSDV